MKANIRWIHSAEIIFVDDGSRDHTFSKLNEAFGNNRKDV